jgi:hypothetical protein
MHVDLGQVTWRSVAYDRLPSAPNPNNPHIARASYALNVVVFEWMSDQCMTVPRQVARRP